MELHGYKYEIGHIMTQNDHDGEEYGEWSQSYDVEASDAIKSCDKYADVVSSHGFSKGDKCYIVYAVWSSGDSFGHASRGESECYGLFKDHSTANELKDGLKSCNNGSIDFKTSDGQSFKHEWLPWKGWFESLDDIYIKEVTVTN